jgi:hypothetical protein
MPKSTTMMASPFKIVTPQKAATVLKEPAGRGQLLQGRLLTC